MAVLEATQVGEGICVSCVHKTHCSLRNGHFIWDCSEHESVSAPGIEEKNALQGQEALKGLCATCELKNDCRLRKEGQVIFHCEHFA